MHPVAQVHVLLLYLIYFVTCWEYEKPPIGTNEYDICKQDGGKQWVCRRITECPTARRVIGSGRSLQTCSWKDSRTHIVCCPPSDLLNERQTQRISVKKCADYQSQLCAGTSYRGPLPPTTRPPPTTKPTSNGGDDQVFVIQAIGGELAEPKEHPHMALVGYREKGRISWECGGSLISETFILSAAHCSETAYGPARWARLGDLDVSSDSDDAKPQEFAIVQRIVHPQYRAPAFYNDIVLFRLDRPAVFDQYVGPACLYQSTGDLEGFGVATGWGRNETSGPKSPSLIKVDLKFIPSEQCRQQVGVVTRVLPQGFDKKTMMCAGEPGKDTCQGDSGGPFVLRDRTEHCLAVQVGVTSFGPRACGLSATTGAYVRVAQFLQWIESVVWAQEV